MIDAAGLSGRVDVEAHAAGVVHRDLKPHNLFRHGRVWKILDFGVAKLVQQDLGLTRPGMLMGTAHFMSQGADSFTAARQAMASYGCQF